MLAVVFDAIEIRAQFMVHNGTGTEHAQNHVLGHARRDLSLMERELSVLLKPESHR